MLDKDCSLQRTKFLVGMQIIPVVKEYNVERYYSTMYEQKCKKYEGNL